MATIWARWGRNVALRRRVSTSTTALARDGLRLREQPPAHSAVVSSELNRHYVKYERSSPLKRTLQTEDVTENNMRHAAGRKSLALAELKYRASGGFKFSPMRRLKLLVLQRDQKRISVEYFRRGVVEVFRSYGGLLPLTGFLTFLKGLEGWAIKDEVVQEVIRGYIGENGRGILFAGGDTPPSSGKIVTIFVEWCLKRQDVARADAWLDFHCSMVPPYPTEGHTDSSDDPTPFTVYIEQLCKHIPLSEGDTRDFSPVLAKMSKAGIWPDTAFINALLEAELAQDRASQALALYDVLRTKGGKAHAPKLAPNDETYANLFDAFRRLTRRQRQLWKRKQMEQHSGERSQQVPLTPWRVFRDMVYRQRAIVSSKSKEDGGASDAASHKSVLAALRMFLETSDYTCAIAALSCFAEFRIPLVPPRALGKGKADYSDVSDSVMNIIVGSLVNRCRSELGARRSNNVLPTWTELLLGLRQGERNTLAHLPRSDTEQRVLQLGEQAVDYERHPPLKTFTVTDEYYHPDNPPPPELRKGENVKNLSRWRSRQLFIATKLLHHAIVAEAELALVNTESPEDAILRMLVTPGAPQFGRIGLFQ